MRYDASIQPHDFFSHAKAAEQRSGGQVDSKLCQIIGEKPTGAAESHISVQHAYLDTVKEVQPYHEGRTFRTLRLSMQIDKRLGGCSCRAQLTMIKPCALRESSDNHRWHSPQQSPNHISYISYGR